MGSGLGFGTRIRLARNMRLGLSARLFVGMESRLVRDSRSLREFD
jgi:hypothetical protein